MLGASCPHCDESWSTHPTACRPRPDLAFPANTAGACIDTGALGRGLGDFHLRALERVARAAADLEHYRYHGSDSRKRNRLWSELARALEEAGLRKPSPGTGPSPAVPLSGEPVPGDPEP